MQDPKKSAFRRHSPFRRRGVTIIEVLIVLTVLGVISGMIWNPITLSKRIPDERAVWRDIERIALATRLYRMEKGVLPTGTDILESGGYIGRMIPPSGYKYGFIYEAGPKITIFAGTNTLNASTALKDYFGNTFRIIIQ